MDVLPLWIPFLAWRRSHPYFASLTNFTMATTGSLGPLIGLYRFNSAPYSYLRSQNSAAMCGRADLLLGLGWSFQTDDLPTCNSGPNPNEAVVLQSNLPSFTDQRPANTAYLSELPHRLPLYSPPPLCLFLKLSLLKIQTFVGSPWTAGGDIYS